MTRHHASGRAGARRKLAHAEMTPATIQRFVQIRQPDPGSCRKWLARHCQSSSWCQVDASSAPVVPDRVEMAEAAKASSRREELEAVADVEASKLEAALALKASASEEALARLEQVQARVEQLEASVEGFPKAIPILEFQHLQAEVCSSKGRIDSIETAASSSLARVQELVAAMDGLRNKIEDLRTATADPAVDMVDIRTSMLRLKTRVDHFESQLQPAKVRSAITRVDRLEAATAACQAQLQELSSSLEGTKEGMQGLRTTADEMMVGLGSELQALRDQVERTEAAAAHSESQLELQLEAALGKMKESLQQHLTTEFSEDCRAAFQSIRQNTDEVQAIKSQLGSLQSEMESNRLNDINGRVEHVEGASAAGRVQLQELAASIGGIQESVKQLEGVVAPLDATLPETVEALRKQIDKMESMEANRLIDINRRVEHVEGASTAGHAQLQELAASIGGIQESVKQLEGVVAPLDATLPETVEALRKQIDKVESMEANRLIDINRRVEHVEGASTAGHAQLQELAASIGGIQESVKQLEGVVAPLDATLPETVEALRKQIDKMESMEANRLIDINRRVEHVEGASTAGHAQLQELAASIGGIQESVKQLEGVVAPLDATLPETVEALRKQIDKMESMEANRLIDINRRVEHVEGASTAGHAQLQELAASSGGIQESVKQLEGVVAPLDATLPETVEALRKQIDKVESMEANRLIDINGRVEYVEAASAAGRAQLEELAASIGGIQESVKQLEGVVAPLDATLPETVEAIRKQIVNLQSDIEVNRHNDASGRTQMQELASSIDGINESVRQLRQRVTESDAEIPAAVEAIRTQIDNLQLAMEANSLDDASGVDEATSSGHVQELRAASIDGVRESVRQLQSATAEPEAVALEAMRKRIDDLQAEVEACKSSDFSGRLERVEAASAAGQVQVQELTASIETIDRFLQQLRHSMAEPDAALTGQVEAGGGTGGLAPGFRHFCQLHYGLLMAGTARVSGSACNGLFRTLSLRVFFHIRWTFDSYLGAKWAGVLAFTT